MKKSTILILFCFLISASYAQDCVTFDEQALSAGDTQHPFYLYGDGSPGFLSKWYVTSGTPSIYRSGDIPGVNAFQGNQYTFMGVCDVSGNYTEGLSYTYAFKKGHSYTVSLAMRNVPITGNSPTPIDIDFVLLHDTIPFNYSFSSGCSATPGIPAGSFDADSMRGYADYNWLVHNFIISKVDSNYSQLWLRAVRSAGGPLLTTLWCIDSMCITPLATDPLGVKTVNADKSTILLYPNPASEELSVRFPAFQSSMPSTILITDMLGQVVFQSVLKPYITASEIAISSFSRGVYFVTVTTDAKRSVSKFVKE